ncbi:hypothetical protein [Chishuiella changwenlii]|uniref:hypothetical protein n=1 Tax=Chishuiella changwenlii TaxID=1434701 RepID=UPI002FD952DD
MKKFIYITFLLISIITNAQTFNDFIIKQQLGFYEEKDSKAYDALETLRKFILNKEKNLYVENTENEYYKEFSEIFFNPNIPQQFYSYIPTTYTIKNDIIIFEIDVIESVNINNESRNIVYVNAYILIELNKNKILLNQNNIKLLPNIKIHDFDNINIINHNVNINKKDVLKIKNYIKQQSQFLSIDKKDLEKQNLTIISSNTLNDGYFYYGINKYTSYVNNYKKHKIFAGKNSIYYKHEIIHYLLNLKTEKINPIIDEGLATWLGGSLNYTYEDFLKKSISDKSDLEISTIITNFIEDTDPKNNNKYDYFLRALFVNSIFGSKDRIDEKLLNKLINEELYDYSIKELIDEIGFDKKDLKIDMMNKLKEL